MAMPRLDWRVVARAALALACGMLIGVCINLVWLVTPDFFAKPKNAMFPPSFFLGMVVYASLVFGALIAALSCVVWLGLGLFGARYQTIWMAAVLGFAMTMGVVWLTDLAKGTAPWRDYQFALVGAAAGMSVWFADRIFRRIWPA